MELSERHVHKKKRKKRSSHIIKNESDEMQKKTSEIDEKLGGRARKSGDEVDIVGAITWPIIISPSIIGAAR